MDIRSDITTNEVLQAFLIIGKEHYQVCGTLLNIQYAKFVKEGVNQVDFTDPAIYNFETFDNSTPGPSVAPISKRTCKKNVDNEELKAEVKEYLIKSIQFKTVVHSDQDIADAMTSMTTIADCINSFKILVSNIGDSRKKILYWSILKGEVIHNLMKVSKMKLSKAVTNSKIELTPDYAKFLHNLYLLSQRFDSLMYLQVPVRYIKLRFTLIKQICEENPDLFSCR